MVHGMAILLGTAAVVVGFVAGLLYMLQSYRLKNKIIVTSGLRLPSLEKLQRISEKLTGDFVLATADWSPVGNPPQLDPGQRSNTTVDGPRCLAVGRAASLAHRRIDV